MSDSATKKAVFHIYNSLWEDLSLIWAESECQYLVLGLWFWLICSNTFTKEDTGLSDGDMSDAESIPDQVLEMA